MIQLLVNSSKINFGQVTKFKRFLMENEKVNNESNLQEEVFESPAVVEKIDLNELKSEQEKIKAEENQARQQEIDAEQEKIRAKQEERHQIAKQKLDEAFDRFKKSFESLNEAEMDFINKKLVAAMEKQKNKPTENKN